ncbi:MAG: hypothetical protein ABEH43_03990, partial [Flavobacteriales bacterium]
IQGFLNLEHVSMYCKSKSKIQSVWAFDLPKLEELFIHLDTPNKMLQLSIHNCPNLKKIRINGYKPTSKPVVKKYTNLSLDAKVFYELFSHLDEYYHCRRLTIKY